MSNVRHDLTDSEYLVTHEVGPNQHGVRLDSFLKSYYRRRSREQIQRAIEDGAITVRREQGPHLSVGRLKPSSQLVPGDEVLVLSERKPEPEVDFNYRVLFEDHWLFIIEKPGNLPVHPAGRYFFNTLLVHLRTRGHQDALKADREYFLVHRIDKETSWILVLAKERDACTHLTRQFAARTTEKTYLAIVRGVTPENFSVNLAMRRSTTSLIGLKMETCPDDAEGAQTALTTFKRLQVAGDYSLVECLPKTGRQHQIRVHLDSAGHPIVGDKLYGRDESDALRFYERETLSAEAWAALLLPRHALHSTGLRFDHPITGERLEFRSPLPSDLSAFLQAQAAEPAIAARRPTSLSSAHPSQPTSPRA